MPLACTSKKAKFGIVTSVNRVHGHVMFLSFLSLCTNGYIYINTHKNYQQHTDSMYYQNLVSQLLTVAAVTTFVIFILV